ncbi:DUF4183 domain-containing protein [Paenibacillus segetis]|uniref:DUF4183 domain-containing protein n=1 Tax=Paenibacillus segetis TaxID=1325360 RepID=A0ABQ1Y2R6_9BACL|nr:DUF4183 domain-containing protein [Paenibacillus segetis]GGH09764.1 hypothetical protein GCM10008013_00920 [Paenibacillus segetis]
MSVIKMYLTATSTVLGNVNTTTTTNTSPTVERYTASIVLGNIIGGTTVVPATSFTNDSGSAVAVNGLVVPSSDGYYSLYVNNELQRGGISSLTAANLTIDTVLVVGVTVVIEVVTLRWLPYLQLQHPIQPTTSLFQHPYKINF